MLRLTLLIFLFSHQSLSAQGHIEHIKNQAYLKGANNLTCDSTASDNLSIQICANLAFQKSDSSLTVAYNNLLKVDKVINNQPLKMKVVGMQKKWRDLRDDHCAIIYDEYEGCGGCHEQAIAYMTCLKELTDDRTKELEKLIETLK